MNVVDILEIYLLPQVGTGFGSTTVCKIAQRALCNYIVTADADDVKAIRKLNKEYQVSDRDSNVDLILKVIYQIRDGQIF